MTLQAPRGAAVCRAVLFLLAFAGGLLACAQTVRPLIDELGNPGKGRIEYVNDSMTPLNVVLQAKSFTVSETGAISYRPLDANIHLKLSTTSFRIQPQQTFYVFYEASADASPAWFVVYALFSGFPFRTSQGMNVQLQLPHTVYLLPKETLNKAEVQISRAEFDATRKQMQFVVENTGDHFGRILQTQFTYARRKEEAPGFPIFPHSRRIMDVPLEASEPPDGMILQFDSFKVEQKLSDRSP